MANMVQYSGKQKKFKLDEFWTAIQMMKEKENVKNKNIVRHLETLHQYIMEAIDKTSEESETDTMLYPVVIAHFTDFAEKIRLGQYDIPEKLTESFQALDHKLKKQPPMSKGLKTVILGVIGAIIGFAIGAALTGGLGALPGAIIGATLPEAIVAGGVLGGFTIGSLCATRGFFGAKINAMQHAEYESKRKALPRVLIEPQTYPPTPDRMPRVLIEPQTYPPTPDRIWDTDPAPTPTKTTSKGTFRYNGNRYIIDLDDEAAQRVSEIMRPATTATNKPPVARRLFEFDPQQEEATQSITARP